MVSYSPRKRKRLILASLHEVNYIDLDIGDKKTSCIKGEVDTTDKLYASLNLTTNIRRWPMVVLFAMLNISGINAQLTYFDNNPNVIRRKTFLKTFSVALVLPHTYEV